MAHAVVEGQAEDAVARRLSSVTSSVLPQDITQSPPGSFRALPQHNGVGIGPGIVLLLHEDRGLGAWVDRIADRARRPLEDG